jgi:hypothetical protein
MHGQKAIPVSFVKSAAGMMSRPGFCVLALMMLIACQPSDVRPGLWLSGEEVTESVDDWKFAADIEEIFIETNPWYGIAHSTTIWCVVYEGALYIGSYGEEKKTWENNVIGDSDARLRISGKLYPVVVTRISDKELTADLDLAYNEKYDMEEVFGKDVPTWWFYRVQPGQ